VLNPTEDVFNLLRANVGIEQSNRKLAVQRAIGPPQPRGCFIFAAEHDNGEARNPSDSIQAIGLIRGEFTCVTATCQGP
jgi:hypothetical protein